MSSVLVIDRSGSLPSRSPQTGGVVWEDRLETHSSPVVFGSGVVLNSDDSSDYWYLL